MTHGGLDGPWADTCRVGEARHCDSWPGSVPSKCHIGTMGWLLSCRQNYAEAIDILYSTNTIIMANEAMITHLPQLLLPQRLASITSLEISWNLKSRYESGLWIITDDEYFIDEEDLKRISQITSTQFPQLHRLYLSLEHSRQLGPCWGPKAWPAISLHLDNLARVMLSLTEHAISLPDTPFDSILYDAKETGFVLYSEICHSYNQIWRSTDGAMDVIRLPYVDSYPKAPNWPEKEKLVIGPPPMGEIMGLSPHDFDDFDDVATATATTESTSSEATATSSSSGTTFTTDEATTTKAATTLEETTSSTEDADATPTIDPNYQPLVQQDPECLEPADGDHGAIDPGWETGADIQHSYKETSHGVVYEYKVNWAQDCITDGDTQDIRWPLGQAGDITAYSLMRGAFEKWNNGGIGGSIQAGRLVYTFNGYDE
ncbi:hypothetical protein QSH57_008357 [Fusarium oxysporum f. sp. vasinfectum]|nr:hypothetical protein QSH57_008357 [Fusarium oxysporum f. sp. vasinfectum]